jgi:hypothetical protein
MKAYGGVAALDEVSGQFHSPAVLPQGKAYSTRWTGGWVAPRGVLDAVGKEKCHPAGSLATKLSLSFENKIYILE